MKKYLIVLKFILMFSIMVLLLENNSEAFLMANWLLAFLVFVNVVVAISWVFVLSCLLGEFGPKTCISAAQMFNEREWTVPFYHPFIIEMLMCGYFLNHQPLDELFLSLGYAYLGTIVFSSLLYAMIFLEVKKILVLHSFCEKSISDIKEKLENATIQAEQK